MVELSNKQLSVLCYEKVVIDLTEIPLEQLDKMRAKMTIDKVAFSKGVNGITGVIFRDRNTGKSYGIRCRNSNLLYML